ncbi:MAG: LemA family protein, partial [Planctomycetota bacterium]
HDLIPNLIATAKGYMKHEQETLEKVIQARNSAVAAAADPGAGPAAVAGAENALTGVLRQFFALSENYPDLKANENMLQVQEELTSTENRIAFSRQHYNDSVRQYNTKLEQIPTNIVKNFGDFPAMEFFEIEDPAERQAPKVEF